MKKLLFLFFSVSLFSLNSCKKCYTCVEDCVDCNAAAGFNGTICKDDYTPISGISWETYKGYLITAGCAQKNRTSETCDETTSLVNDGYVCTEKD